MQIVINIDNYQLEHCKRHVKEHFANLLEEAIANGTPLSKGYGRLIDADALREEVSSWGMNDYEPSDFIDAIDQADTIIEADDTTEKEL